MKNQTDHCLHPNKIMVDGFNYDLEVYWECPDCGAGWRAEPVTDEEIEQANRLSDERDSIDLEQIGGEHETAE